MNYLILRFLILFITLTIMFFIIIKMKLYNKILSKIGKPILSKLILLFIFFIIYKVIWIFPYEGTILKFSSVDNIITHFIRDDKIIKKYIFDDYAYVLYKNDTGFPEFVYFIKNEKNDWKLGNISYDGHGKIIQYDDKFISIIEIPSKNSIGIQIYNPMVNKEENYEVCDSLNSKIDTFKYDIYKNYETDYNEIINVVIINKKIDSNYTIYFNGKEYKPFK